MLNSLGWLATAMFVGSYFCKRPAVLRTLQALAALVWIAYGVLIGAAPVIVANIAVAGVAGYSAWRSVRSRDALKASDHLYLHQEEPERS